MRSSPQHFLRIGLLPRLLNLSLALVLAAYACAPARPDRTVHDDSAGVEIVTNFGGDLPLAWAFETKFTLEETRRFSRLNREDIGIDAAGSIFVLDQQDAKVHVFSRDGSHVGTVGRKGEGPGELASPYSLMTSPDGDVFVYDGGKQVVAEFDREGMFISAQKVTVPWVSRLTYFGEARLASVQVLRSEEEAEHVDEALMLVDGSDTTEIHRLPLETRVVNLPTCNNLEVSMDPLFSASINWDADTSGDRLVLSAQPSYVVNVLVDGQLTASFRRTIDPRTLSDAEAASEVDTLRIRGPDGRLCTVPPREVLRARGHTGILPAIDDLALAPDGSIWVKRGSLEGEDHRIDVLASDGRYHGTLPVGSPFPAAFTPPGDVVAIEVDELDVPHVRVYSVKERS